MASVCLVADRPASARPGQEAPDRGGGAPWAMQVVVRVERDPAPQHGDLLRATASGVVVAMVAFLGPGADPEVRARTERWRTGPIRKVVRRARGAGWTRQLAVPGVHVHESHGVAVAVHVPGPVNDVHPEVARLQVGGLTLDDHDDHDDHDDTGSASPDLAADVRLWLNPYVAMTTGKAAAQVGHAAQLVLESLPPEVAEAWVGAGAPVQVSTAGEDAWQQIRESAPVVVEDGGFTEVAPGTVTVVATHPWGAA